MKTMKNLLSILLEIISLSGILGILFYDSIISFGHCPRREIVVLLVFYATNHVLESICSTVYILWCYLGCLQ